MNLEREMFLVMKMDFFKYRLLCERVVILQFQKMIELEVLNMAFLLDDRCE